jgi:hypothetical protein
MRPPHGPLVVLLFLAFVVSAAAQSRQSTPIELALGQRIQFEVDANIRANATIIELKQQLEAEKAKSADLKQQLEAEKAKSVPATPRADQKLQ